MKYLENKILVQKKKEMSFCKNKEKYKKKKISLINEYEKKLDNIIIDFNKLKENCITKEKKLAKMEDITKYINEQFSLSKIQFENKMNEYVIFLKKKDSEIYMLKELIKEKEKTILYNDNILKQYKKDVDDILKENIEKIDDIKKKLKTQEEIISQKDRQIETLENNLKIGKEKINKFDNEIQKLQYKINIHIEKETEIKKNK